MYSHDPSTGFLSLDAEGAVTEIRALLPPVLPPAALAKLRGRTVRQVTGCQACPLHQFTSDGPVPMELGSDTRGRPARWVVVGEAPGPDEDARGRPFIGKSGKLLRARMQNEGMDTDEGVFMNANSCVPRDEARGKFRTPTDDEQMACRPNLLAQLEASGATCVLLVGAKALHTWRPDLQVSTVNGYPYKWTLPFGDVMVVPVLHPAGVLRNRAGMDEFNFAIYLFAAMVEDAVNWQADPFLDHYPLDWMSTKCGRGDRTPMAHYDPDGVPYCEEHWERWQFAWRRARERWDGKGSWEGVRIRGGRKKGEAEGQQTLDGTP